MLRESQVIVPTLTFSVRHPKTHLLPMISICAVLHGWGLTDTPISCSLWGTLCAKPNNLVDVHFTRRCTVSWHQFHQAALGWKDEFQLRWFLTGAMNSQLRQQIFNWGDKIQLSRRFSAEVMIWRLRQWIFNWGDNSNWGDEFYQKWQFSAGVTSFSWGLSWFESVHHFYKTFQPFTLALWTCIFTSIADLFAGQLRHPVNCTTALPKVFSRDLQVYQCIRAHSCSLYVPEEAIILATHMDFISTLLSKMHFSTQPCKTISSPGF